MLEVNCKSILFDEVAVNDIPTYRPVRVQNKTDASVSVNITTSSSLLRFQLQNENYDTIQQVGLRDSVYVYNEAFDLVGVISSFDLAPREKKQLVVAFRADPATFSHLVTGAAAVPFNGTVQFTAVASTSALLPPAGNRDSSAESSGDSTKGNDNNNSQNSAGKNASQVSSPATTGVALQPQQQQQQRTETFTIPFRANVYISFLKLSSSEIHVTMAPNKTQVVDFVVTNTSCQPVLFLIRDQPMPLKGLDVALYEADRLEDPKLGHRILLDGYASMTFSLLLRSSGANPNAQQQYNTVFQCDNLRDSRNTTFIYVHVNVGTESQGDLVAFPDTSVDFGDVYRGTKAFAQLRVQNISGREDAVVRLADADRRKYDGKFSLMRGDAAVDELLIAAQKGNPLTTITLMYQPSYDVDSKEAAKKKFDVELLAQSAGRADSQRVVIRCAAMLYTSNIVVSQRSVNFGDCQVGQSKRYTLQIENHSPLKGKVVVQLRSKIIQVEGISRTNTNAGRELREEFTIAPSASLPLTLKITPQRVNPMYRKQLTIINASNPAEDRQVINIEANNMAPLDTKLHDELYSWKCDLGGGDGSSSTTDDAGARRGPSTLWAISDVPLLVPYSVQSKVSYEVVLNLRSSSPEIEVFYSADVAMCDRLGEISAEMRRFCLYGEGEDPSYLTNESAEQLFNAREELLRLLSETSQNITNRIVLAPNASLKAYALIIRTACPTEPLTKEDGISIAVDGIEAPRFVRLSYRLCGTMFELNGQKTKNFGEVNIGVKKTTKLPIVNRCNSFLFLHLSKSRSVTAEHIRMEHSEKQSIFLTIRPYASREIELTLYPGIKGMLQEKIRVTNILHIQNSITMTIKAVVTKADTFEISPDSWTFEMMVPPSANMSTLTAPSPSSSPSAALAGLNQNADDGTGGGGASAGAPSNARVGAKFTLANTSNSRRQIIARVELSNSNAATGVTASNPYLAFPGVKVAVQLDMTLTGASSVSTRKLEEQIEKLEQKLKIYVRKKKTEKADNARRKIEAYKLALKGEEVDLTALESTQLSAQGATDHELSESEDESSTNALQALKSKSQQSDIAQLLRREGVALPSMGAGESVMITLFLVCKRVPEESIPATQSQTMNILFYEARDQEANRIIPIDMILLRTPGDTFPHPLPAVQLLTSGPAAVKATAASGQANGDASRGGVATNPLTAPTSLRAASGGALSRVPQVRPPPSIRLTTTGAVASGGGTRFHSTFMGHPLLVLRNCIVNDQTEFSFLVEADGNTTIVVLEPRRCGGSVAEALDARFKLFPRNGHVRQQEPLRIVVECTARSVGPQKYFIPVKNIRNAEDVHYLTVELNPTEEIDMLTTEPKELFFRDVITPCAPSQLETQVVLIRSRFPFPHALVVRTNKPSQVALFEDASCTTPLLHPIRRVFVKETVRVYVQLRPGARYVDPRARNIHAGVLVEAVAPNPTVSNTAFCVVGKAVLRAVACVGSGLVDVPQRCVELGCVPCTQHYVKTQFTVRNTSYSFSLRIGLTPSSPLVEVVDDAVRENEITLAPLEEHVVALVLHLPSPGLAQGNIDVVNHSSAQEIVRVALSALRLNDGIMQVEPALNTPLAFPMAAVVRGENCKELHLHQPVSCSIKMANYHSNREVVLATAAITQASRELPLWFHTSEEEAQVRTAVEEEQRHTSHSEVDGAAAGPRSGPTAPTSTPTSSQLRTSTYVKGRVELQANRAQVVMWTLTDLPPLTAEEAEAVLQHRLVTITATMQVCVTYTAHSAKTAAAAAGFWQSHTTPRSYNNRYRGPAVGQCVLLVPVTLSLSMSEGRAEPAVVNLGLVAKATSPLVSPTSADAEVSDDEADATEADDGTTPTTAASANAANNNNNNNNEEAAFAARVRRRRRVRLAQLRRPGNHQQFSSYSTKSGLPQSSGHNMVVSFRLVNLSSVMPLPLKVECPPVIHFSQTRLTIPPGASTSVDATLNLKLITTQGNFRYEAFFVNEWNPENDMAVCITGQHYWKVFKILRTDTEDELRDAVTLAPLRVEPSLQAPLSELKLAFVATEPDVEFDLHVQQNPQLDGLLELLLLHYDATSAARHLSFPSDLPAGGTGNAALNAAAAGTATPVSTPAASAPPTANAGPAVAAAGAHHLASPTSVAAPGSVTGMGGVPDTPLMLGEDVAGQPFSAATAAVAAGGGGGGGATTTAAAASTAAVNAVTSASAVKMRKAGAAPSGSGYAAAVTRSQRLRLRCVLRSGDLASLASIFFGFRKSRTNAAAAVAAAANAGQGSHDTSISGGAAAGEGGANASAVAWTYDRIAEVERRNATLVSNNVWLGTAWVANPFTEDEEVQVYGTLSPFRTFTAPAKVSLRPCRISVEAPKWLTQADGASGGVRPPQVGYVGEIVLTNEFDVYVADISVAVLVSDRLGVPLEIDVRGGQRVSSSASAGSYGGGTAVSMALPAETMRGDIAAAEADAGAATAPSKTVPTSASVSIPTPAPAMATSFTAGGGTALPTSQPHCLQLGPRETVVLTVAIRPTDPRGGSDAVAAASTPSLPLSSLEQFVSVLAVDDNIPFSYNVSRVHVVTPADGVEALLPTVTLSASAPLTQQSLGTVAAALPPPLPSASATRATALGAASPRESDRIPRSPTMSRGDAIGDEGPAAAAPGEESPEPPLSRVSQRSSAHTAHGAADEAAGPLPPSVAVEPGAAEAIPIGTSVATSESGETGLATAVQSRVSGSEAAMETQLSATTRSIVPAVPATTAAAATTVMPCIAPDAAAPRHWVLSLRNCDPLPGCGGAYVSNFSVARDDTYDPNILITNHLPNTAVRYNVQVVSQSPLVWLLLTCTSGVLEGGETHPLRLQVLSSDVGSFVGYVAVTNAYDPREVVYLRINAEVFVPGTAEGLFDVVAMNGGYRLATTSAVHNVNMGALYGPGSTRTRIALEIVNKGNVALEFPVSVVHPMRQELRPIPQSVWYGNAVATSSRRLRHTHAAEAATTPRQLLPYSGETQLNTPNSLSVSTPSLSPSIAAVENTRALFEMALHTQAPQRSPLLHHHHHHHHHHHSPNRHAVSRMGSTAAATASAATPSSAALFEGKLVVCHIHNVATRTGQKYFVVDPRSPLRLAFLLSCTALHDIPEGHGVFGEVDVVFKCKQARDAQFAFTVKFEAFKPTFAVALEYDMDAAESSACDATEGTRSGTPTPTPTSMPFTSLPSLAASPAPWPTRVAAASDTSRWSETKVVVTNLSRTHTQVFALFSQSEVLTLAPAGAAADEQIAPPGSQLLPPVLGATFSDDGTLPSSPAVEVTVAPQSVGVFVVRLDRLRAEALLNFDKDESKLARPALCEHAYLYNKGNPRERVQLLFRQKAVSVSVPQRQSSRADATMMAAGPVSPTRPDAKPVKGSSTQHFSERHILGFAQRFSAVLTSLAERLPFATRSDDTADGGNGDGAGSGVGEAGGATSGTKGSAGDYAAAVVSGARSGGNTPGQQRHRGAGPRGRSGGVDDSGGGAVKGDRRAATLHGSRLDSSDGSTTTSSDDSTATTTSSDESNSSENGDEDTRTISSTLTEDSSGMLFRPARDTVEELGSRDIDAEGPLSRVTGVTGAKLTRSGSEGIEGDRPQRQQTPLTIATRGRMRSAESSADVLAFSPNSLLLSSMVGGGSTRSSAVIRSNEETRWCEALSTLHDLLVELTWLCDELLFYAILLRNSRHVEACGAFLVSAVSQHPVMVAWRRRRGSSSNSSRAREFDIFGRFLDTIDALPRTSNSTS